VPDHTIEDLLARLERERSAADRLYNDALTAVDKAIQTVPTLPAAPSQRDETRLPTINHRWNILPDGIPSFDRTVKGRLRQFVWRLVGPPLVAQRELNAAFVDHLNRNAAADREVTRAVSVLLDLVGRELAALVRFESLLVQYLQTITVYVDSKDRILGGAELRDRLALTEQRLLALKRDVDQRVGPAGGAAASSPPAPFGGSVDSLTYVGFEDRFRGTRDDIARRVEDFLPILGEATDVLDVGCGRGELLDALRTHGVAARGVDSNRAMVEVSRSRGLSVEHGDALEYLSRLTDASLGGLVAIQVVEHFEPGYLTRFLETAYHKLRPGAPLVLETINPACWMAFFECYLRDLTHQRPLHPDTLRYLVQASGFSRVDVQFRQPVGEADRLPGVATRAVGEEPDTIAEVVEAINAHADRLNARLFSSMDYAVVARR
jgi:SAM-dependent methyltransferase